MWEIIVKRVEIKLMKITEIYGVYTDNSFVMVTSLSAEFFSVSYAPPAIAFLLNTVLATFPLSIQGGLLTGIWSIIRRIGEVGKFSQTCMLY